MQRPTEKVYLPFLLLSTYLIFYPDPFALLLLLPRVESDKEGRILHEIMVEI